MITYSLVLTAVYHSIESPFPVPIPKPKFTVFPLILIAATPVGASISTLALYGFPLLRINPLFQDMVIVLITCDFSTPAPPVRNFQNGFTSFGSL